MKRRLKQVVSCFLTLVLVLSCLAGTGMTARAAELVEITAVTVDSEKIQAGGDTVRLKVTGTNLTEDNWGVETERYISGTNIQPSSKAGQATVIEITDKEAVIDISANGMKNDIDFVFSVGPKSGDRITKTATVTVTQEGKDYDTVTTIPTSVEMADEYTVVATFEEEIVAAKEGDALKKLFYVTGSDGNRYDLGENDTVTVNENAVKIQFEDSMSEAIKSGSYLYIKEGALKLENEKILTDIKWIISASAKISSIVLDKEILDSKGGTVCARLEGYKVENISDDAIEAVVYLAGETVKSEIEIIKSRDEDGTPTLTFDVPENTTDNTVSYWLSVRVSGTPVYEGASLNRAQRATVSVLPEGKTDKDRTLSMLTISGNNKQETGDIKNITVNVSSAVGELKTELRLYGTNLDSSLTKVRAIDQNGIIWPVYDIPECDGTIRFVAIAGTNKNGVFGDGNTQLIEVLPPRYVGPDMTYTLQVAIDGVNFIEVPNVTLTVRNSGLTDDSEFVSCGEEDIKTVTVKYEEEGTGKELVPADEYKGYSVSMLRGFDIAAKEIEGYELVSEPEIGENEFVGDGKTFIYVYKSTTPEITPVTPEPEKVKVSSIKIGGISHKIAAGKKIQLKAAVAPSNADNKAVTWTSSNKKYATVTSSGKVTLKKAGAGKTVTITATAKDGSNKTAVYRIKIMKDSVKSISLKAVKTVKAGKTVKVKSSVKTTGKKANKNLTWTSSNKKYATVSSKGVVKTYKAGKGKTVKITAKATDGSNKKKTVKIKIK
ncbi:MAG: Ig-like domain-containing protein [Lachnospiraceae bacterium]